MLALSRLTGFWGRKKGPTFKPSDIPAVKAWWDGSDASSMGINGSNQVTSWADKVGGLTVPFSAPLPTYTPGYVTPGRGQLGSNGSLPTGITDGWIFVVAKAVYPQNDSSTYLTWFDYGSGGGDRAIRFNQINKFPSMFDGSRSATDSAHTIDTDAYIQGAHFNSTTSEFWVDGAMQVSVAGLTSTAADKIAIGCTTDALTASNPTGYLYQIIVTTALTTAERQKIEGYLAWKTGRQASLPTGHPWKAVAP